MKYKLLALDIDGTLVKPHTNTPTKKTIDTVIEAAKYIQVSLVSARAWKDLQPLIHLLKLKNFYHVIENGTKVISPEKLIIHDKRLSVNETEEIIKNIQDLSNDIAFCIDGTWVKDIPKENSPLISTISVISYDNSKAERIPIVMKQLTTNYHVTVGAHWSESQWRVSLISHPEASKGKGLSVIQSAINITPSETIAIGDGASDVPTMEYAGLKVAMGNAEPELNVVANYTAPSVDEDGVAYIIQQFILPE